MKRRQAKKCVQRHCAPPGTHYPRPTWQRVLQTLARHRLIYWVEWTLEREERWVRQMSTWRTERR